MIHGFKGRKQVPRRHNIVHDVSDDLFHDSWHAFLSTQFDESVTDMPDSRNLGSVTRSPLEDCGYNDKCSHWLLELLESLICFSIPPYRRPMLPIPAAPVKNAGPTPRPPLRGHSAATTIKNKNRKVVFWLEIIKDRNFPTNLDTPNSMKAARGAEMQ